MRSAWLQPSASASRYIVCGGWLEGWPEKVLHRKRSNREVVGVPSGSREIQSAKISNLGLLPTLRGSMWRWLRVLPAFPSPTSFLWACPGWLNHDSNSPNFQNRPVDSIRPVLSDGYFDTSTQFDVTFWLEIDFNWWYFFCWAECRQFTTPLRLPFCFLHRST